MPIILNSGKPVLKNAWKLGVRKANSLSPYTSLLTTITVNCLYNKEQIAFSNFFVFRMDEKGEKSKVFIDHKVFANLTTG